MCRMPSFLRITVGILLVIVAGAPAPTIAMPTAESYQRLVLGALKHPLPTDLRGSSITARTARLAELGKDAMLPTSFGPLPSDPGSPDAAGCTWYYFWLPNFAGAPLPIDFITMDDPSGFPGGPMSFAQGWTVPPHSVIYGWVLVDFCATRLEIQYNYNNSVARANQRFFQNFAPYSFTWEWLEIRGLVPTVGIAYFNTSGLYPPPQEATSANSTGPTPCQSPWSGTASCSGGFSSWDVLQSPQVGGPLPALGPVELSVLLLLLAAGGVVATRRRSITANGG